MIFVGHVLCFNFVIFVMCYVVLFMFLFLVFSFCDLCLLVFQSVGVTVYVFFLCFQCFLIRLLCVVRFSFEFLLGSVLLVVVLFVLLYVRDTN